MLNGKKLLILGCTVSEFQIIDAAREMGVYTIVTDNHVDWTQAPAKYRADEAWDISWSDIPALKERAIASGVDGVMAGYSERRIEYAIKLSRELNKPFYADGKCYCRGIDSQRTRSGRLLYYFRWRSCTFGNVRQI